MTNILIVPLHLDALLLSTNKQVVEATSDFSKLPFFDGTKDVNPDTANLSESILSKEFENQNLTLKKGVHLHWALPDGLTKGVHNPDTNTIKQVAVPNRWLVTRTLNGQTKQWIIESDYLHPEGEENVYGAVTYPIDISQQASAVQPFRYLGRQLPFSGWQEDASAERLSSLTAVGYGEPTFAAFYPNCHSVFGAYDSDFSSAEDLAGAVYDVLGWYSDTSSNPLHQLITDLQNTATADGKTLSTEDIEQAIADEFQWQTTLNSLDVAPTAIVCYAQIEFNPAETIDNTTKNGEVSVSLANTGLEALSTYLANRIVEEGATNGESYDKNTVEEQLEAIQLLKKIANKSVDIGPKFREAFHRNGFTTLQGGSEWAITTKGSSTSTTTSASATKQSQPEVTLPTDLAALLSNLNQLQSAYDQKSNEITQARQQLFSDWYKYMQAAYPPEDSLSNYPEVDSLRFYLQAQGITNLDRDLDELSQLYGQLTGDDDSAYTVLAAALEVFNQGTIDSTVLSQLFDSSDNTVNENLSLTNSVWVENTPFSKQCLAFNNSSDNSSAYLTAFGSDTTTTAKALSLWVYIDSVQSDSAACLLYIPAESDAVIASTYVGSFWSSIYVNGELLDPYAAKSWHMIPKDQWVHLHLQASKSFSVADMVLMAADDSSSFLSGKLAGFRLFSDTLTRDEVLTDMNMLRLHTYVLQQRPRDPYYSPKEPVVLLQGGAIEASERYGFDGRLNDDDLLECESIILEEPLNKLDQLRENAVELLGPQNGEEKIGFSEWATQPWHPIMMEWKAEFFPVSEGNNLQDQDQHSFDPNYITDNFSLDENEVDFTPATSATTLVPPVRAIYSGRSILTPYAQIKLKEEIKSLLNGLQRSDCYQVTTDISDEQLAIYNEQFNAWFVQKKTIDESTIDEFKSWYEFRPVYDGTELVEGDLLPTAHSHRQNDPNYIALLAYEHLVDDNFTSQSLGGFNAALLQHKQVMQLPIADPLGFSDYQSFSEQVKNYVGQESRIAPVALSNFSPIRCGSMSLLELRVIDSFGQVNTDINVEEFLTPEKLTPTGQFVAVDGRDRMYLPTRFVQPTRVNVSWLSASNGEVEMNTHPATSPICGWLLPNHLDASIMVYDHNGYVLGEISSSAIWQSAPGNDVVVRIEDIENSYLQQVLTKLCIVSTDDSTTQNEKQAFTADFISAINASIETIDPENYGQHQDLALLMGKPIAVVRAVVSLETQGEPCIDHSWHSFRKVLPNPLSNRRTSPDNQSRDNSNWDDIRIPVRIGEREQLGDGVLGYWLETDAAELGDSFYTTLASGTLSNKTTEAIKYYDDDPLNLTLSLNDNTQSVTLLMDPKAKVHVTTAIVPRNVIDIPPDQYTPALKTIEVSFLTAPILSPANALELPLVNEPGYQWSWLEKSNFLWKEIKTDGLVTKASFTDAFSNGTDIWQALKDYGWIREISADTAAVVPKDQRTSDTLSSDLLKDIDAIKAILEQGHINPVQTQANFKANAIIREGWLKLSNS
ncbi:MAG: LamG domain-containing protein [Moorea sp. SIO3G5]|nr:LamG domain-containing protein [Moorena sp. SIO3G5]